MTICWNFEQKTASLQFRWKTSTPLRDRSRRNTQYHAIDCGSVSTRSHSQKARLLTMRKVQSKRVLRSPSLCCVSSSTLPNPGFLYSFEEAILVDLGVDVRSLLRTVRAKENGLFEASSPKMDSSKLHHVSSAGRTTPCDAI